jgi:hypothetical protein
MRGAVCLISLFGLATAANAADVLQGTGFFIAEHGIAVTNAHVFASCEAIAVRVRSANVYSARLIASDGPNDLALIGIDTQSKIVSLPLSTRLRLGDEAYVFGFPLSGLLSDSGNFTSGSVTALAGLKNDSTQFQISTPVQPGNSGGPVLDASGNLIGVVVGKLNAIAAARIIEDIPENVNFAIRTQTLESFLQSQNVVPSTEIRTQKLSAADIAEIAQSASVKIYCKETRQQQAQRADGVAANMQSATYWDHNGSKMRLIASATDRQFVYYEPRQGMIDVGVRAGTVLFSGKRQGNSYSGSAYIFTPHCGTLRYEVTGTVSEDDRQVTLHGNVPTTNSMCEVVGYKDDTLIFTYQAH